MPKKQKISLTFCTIFAILCLTFCIVSMTINLSEVWAKPALPNALYTETYEINGYEVYRYTGEDVSPVVDNYKGLASLFWYDPVEQAMWFTTDEEELYDEFCVYLNEHPLPTMIDTYWDRVTVYFDATFENYNYVVNDWHLVDILTQENLGKMTNEQLINKYDIEKNHRIVKKGKLPDTIYLSQLNPNVIYSYTTDPESLDYPVIVNDIAKDCVLYTKHVGYDLDYGLYACPAIILDSANSVWASPMYEEGDAYNIMYTLTDAKSLYNLARDEVVTINQLLTSDNPYLFYMYVYNETDTIQTLKITRDFTEDKMSFIQTIQPGQLIGCWSPAYRAEVISPSAVNKST